MEGNILQTAVIGLGRIAWSDHLPELARNPERYHICAVVDPIRERGQEAMDTFGADRWYDSVESMLASEKPDLGVICSPTPYHASQAIALMEHGVHVFCDKPVASNLAETRAMFAAAEQHNRRLMLFQPRRVFSNSFAIKEIIQTGKLGELYQLKLYIGNFVRRNDWQAFRKNGGGMLRNYGAHYVDQMISLLGEELETLACQTAKVASIGDADDVVKILLRGRRSGILAEIDINQASGFIPYVWALYGSCGAAYLMRHGGSWALRYFDPADLPPIGAIDSMAAPGREYPHEDIPFRTEEYKPCVSRTPVDFYYENLYDYLCGNGEPLVPAADTLHLMSLLDECRVLAEGV